MKLIFISALLFFFLRISLIMLAQTFWPRFSTTESEKRSVCELEREGERGKKGGQRKRGVKR